MSKPVVAIVGKPNVGKSTIFNKLVGKQISIVEDTPGVTRDRIYGNVNYKDYSFHLVDTGGIDVNKDLFNEEIKVQVEIAINEADVILFVVDGKVGLDSNDFAVRDMLLKCSKKVIVIINKVDSKESNDHLYDFYELGFNDYVNVSGEQNIGIDDLLKLIVKDFNPSSNEEYDEGFIRMAVIGRPNVGKSSLVNAIVNEERVIVGDTAGTTRDAVDMKFRYNDQDYVIIDTAGMRKKGKVYENIEKYSLLRALRAIDRSDVCLVVIDAIAGIMEHDKHIAGYAIEAGKAVIIVVNKWDAIDNKDQEMKDFTKKIRNNFQFIPYAPIVFLSALTKRRIHTLMPNVLKVAENHHKEISTRLLNDVIKDAYALNLPPSYKGKRLKVYFCVQVSTKPPTFNIQVNSKGLIHFSYERYLENKIREAFDLEGTPIVIQFKNKGEE